MIQKEGLPKEVPEWKLDRILYHLWKVEKQIGSLRSPRLRFHCPILRYAPKSDNDGRPFIRIGGDGRIYYKGKEYKIYGWEDERWWRNLSKEKALQVLLWLDQLLFGKGKK